MMFKRTLLALIVGCAGWTNLAPAESSGQAENFERRLRTLDEKIDRLLAQASVDDRIQRYIDSDPRPPATQAEIDRRIREYVEGRR